MTTSFDLGGFIRQLKELLATLPAEDIDPSQIKPNQLKRLRDDIAQAAQRLEKLALSLDPIQLPVHVLDPSDPRTMGELIARTLLEQPRHPLEALPRFYGSGVYAIYYKGDFQAYRPISGRQTPIYVGKADPAEPGATTVQEQGDKLWGRLKDHFKSVKNAENLQLADFECRYLVVKSAWQVTAENYLINRFKPIWNNEMGVCFGFGKHGDSSSTRSNTRSPWDTLHPGRPWAAAEGNVPNPKSPGQIMEDIAGHYRKHPPQE